MFYGYSEGRTPDPRDIDTKLMPSLTEKVLLPKLTGRLIILVILWYLKFNCDVGVTIFFLLFYCIVIRQPSTISVNRYVDVLCWFSFQRW